MADDTLKGPETMGDREEARAAILAALLEEVPFHGWSIAALRRAASAAGYTREAQRLALPRGIPDALAAYSTQCDEAMQTRLAAKDLAALKVREKITLAVRTRLEVMAPHRAAARTAARTLALPFHGPLATGCLYRTVDRIWRVIGDTSTDGNFYSKRAILSGVYMATLMHWLSDESDDYTSTWAFLDARIANVMSFEKAKAGLRRLGADLPSPLKGLAALRYPRPPGRS